MTGFTFFDGGFITKFQNVSGVKCINIKYNSIYFVACVDWQF